MANQSYIPEDDERSSNEPVPDWVKWFREHSIPIASVIAALLVICLLRSASKIDWTKAKDFTDAFRNITQAMAFIAGAIWAYFKFVKGRTFREPLIPAVSGKFAVIDDRIYLVTLAEIHMVRDQQLTSFALFDEEGRSIEPNEIIREQMLIALPGSVPRVYRLKLALRSLSGGTWRVTDIVDKSTFRDNDGLGPWLGL